MPYTYKAVRDGYLGDNYQHLVIGAVGYIDAGKTVTFNRPIEEVFGIRQEGRRKGQVACDWLKPVNTPLDDDKPVMPKMVDSSPFASKKEVPDIPIDPSYQAHMQDLDQKQNAVIPNQNVNVQRDTSNAKPGVELVQTNDQTMQKQLAKTSETAAAAPAAAGAKPQPVPPQAGAKPPQTEKPSGTGNQDVLS